MGDAPYIGWKVGWTRDHGHGAYAIRWQRPEDKSHIYPYTDEGRKEAQREAKKRNQQEYLGLGDL